MDLLDRLLNIGPIDGYLDIHCELRPPWKLDNPRSAQREIPYHVVLSGEVIVEGPELAAATLHAGDILMLPAGVPHLIQDLPPPPPPPARKRRSASARPRPPSSCAAASYCRKPHGGSTSPCCPHA